MPEGLKIVVGGDTTQANQALASFGKQIDLTELKIESFDLTVKTLGQRVALFGGGVNKFTTSFKAIPPVLNQIPPAANKAAVSLKKLSTSSSQATQASINLGRVIQDAPFGFLGIANNINPLLESFQRLRASSTSTGAAMKAFGKSLVGAGGIGLVVSIASTAILLLTNGFMGFSKKAKAAKEEADGFKEAVKGINSEVAAEVGKVEVLVAFIQKETTSRKERTEAIKELQQIAPAYFATLDAEKASVSELTTAYRIFSAGVIRSVEARVLGKQLNSIIEKRMALEKLIGGGIETEVINGRLQVTQIKAFYGTKQDVKKIQDQINEQRKEELRIAQQIASLEPPKGVVKPDVIIKPKKIKQDFFNPLMNLLQRVPFTISNLPVDIERLNLIQIQSDKLKTFKELVEEKIEKQLEGLVVKPELKIAVVTDEATIAAAQLGQDVASAFNEGFKQIAIEGFNFIGEALGTALSGGSIGDVFKNFLSSVGGIIQGIGKQLITLGVTAALANKALSTLFTGPQGAAAAIAAGVALVAVGSAMKQLLSGGVKGFAAGGLVSGPQLALIGEGSGTSRSNPEVVAPLDKLRSMLTGLNGGGRQMVYVTGRLRGRDMVLQNARTERSQRRTTGR